MVTTLMALWGCDSNPHARAPVKAPDQTVLETTPKAKADKGSELIKERWQPSQQALAMNLLNAPLRYAPGRYSQFMVPAGDASFPLLVGRKTGQPLAAAGSKDGRRYLAFGTVPVTYELEPFHDNLKELIGWLVTGQSAALPRSGALVVTANLGSHKDRVARWLNGKMGDLAVADCELLGLDECLAAADLLIVGGEGTEAQGIELVERLKARAELPVLYFHTPHWKKSAFATQVLASLELRQGEEGGNYWAQDAANWVSVPDMFEMRLASLAKP
ncbi:hypothetical protein [Gallaecimonas sp. GXIMD4217]|uniref:hypothetical protein n=1 Tax=Gallaecimonas sp. GXIMD4217 TaxID=3131927 RepID=UPI00311AE42C